MSKKNRISKPLVYIKKDEKISGEGEQIIRLKKQERILKIIYAFVVLLFTLLITVAKLKR